MAILYSLPRINENGDFGQKGPNCWYYGSKLLLKFHDRLDKRDDNITLKEFKSLHRLRKVLCEIADREKKGTKEEALTGLRLALATLYKEGWDYRMYEPGGVQYQHRKRIFDHFNPDAASTIGQLERAIKTLDKIDDELRDRSAIIATFVPTAGFFEPGPYKEVYASPESLEKTLKVHGPIYTGGELTRTFQGGEKSATASAQDILVAVSGLKPGSAHICVVAGIKGTTVYYKDPNYTHELLTHDFALFAAAINEPPLALKCGDSSPEGCSHCQSKRQLI